MNQIRTFGTWALLCVVLGSFAVQTAEAGEPSGKAKQVPAKAEEPAKPAEPPGPGPARASSVKASAAPPKAASSLLPSSVRLPGMGGRSPFAAPPRYTNAVQSLALKGVVRTAQYSGAIVQVADAEHPVVLRTGSRFKLDLDDQRYEFRVAEIKEKSVVFKGKDDKSYEVPIQ